MAQAILYLIAIVLLAAAAFGATARTVNLALLGAALALTAYSLPVISAGL